MFHPSSHYEAFHQTNQSADACLHSLQQSCGMYPLSVFLYSLAMGLYHLTAHLLSPFNTKARAWVQGQRTVWSHWRSQLQHLPADRPRVWMHCSSLGEFEQGRPVLEAIRRQYPEAVLLVTFFSPSGYEVRKHYPGADAIGYLPLDHPVLAARFVQLLQPKLVLWVKYEYWFYTLRALHRQQVPLVLVSGMFRPDQPFFKWYGQLHRRMLGWFTHVFVQTAAAQQLLQPLLPSSAVSIGGDTRFDSVLDTATHWQPAPEVESWLNGATRVIVAGSTWPADEEEMSHAANTDSSIRWIIAPHHVDPVSLADTCKLFHRHVRLSQFSQASDNQNNVLIIDNVGMLRFLYQYGQICYVGGGFTADGIHNVLEAAVYGKPVIHGPEYSKYPEAEGLLTAGGSAVIESALELEALLQKLWNEPGYGEQMGKAAAKYVTESAGATQRVLQLMADNKWL